MEQFYGFVLTVGLCGLSIITLEFINKTTQALLRGEFPKSYSKKFDFWVTCLIWNPAMIYVLYIAWETLL